MARRRGARGAFLPRRRRRFHTRGARGRRQGHRLRPRDLAAPDGARDARRTIVARDEHRRGPSLSTRKPAKRRGLAALRSEERSVGKGRGHTGRYRWWPSHTKKPHTTHDTHTTTRVT